MKIFKKILFEDQTLTGDIQKVTEFRYVKILRFNLSYINGWPGQEIGEDHSKYVSLKSAAQIMMNQFCMGTGVAFILLHSDKSFYELGHMIVTVLMGFVALAYYTRNIYWPGQEIGEDHSKYVSLKSAAQIMMNQFCMGTGVAFILLHSDKSFYELGHMIVTVLMGFVALSRILSTLPQSTIYRNLAATFLTKMHLLFYKDVSEYAMQKYRKVYFISHRFTLFLTCEMIAGIILFNVTPMWKNYSSGKYEEKILYNTTYEHSLYLAWPILKAYTHFDAYVVACCFNLLMSCLCSASFCMVDLLLFLMVFNIWGHFKILLHDLGTFPMPANKVILSMNDRNATVNAEMYSEEELKLIFDKLIQCVDYHRLIKDFTDKMSEVFGPILLIYYAFHQVCGCILLLECSQMTPEALARYIPLSIIIFQQLILLSVIFELVGSTSEKLKDAVYGVPWEYMDKKNRKIVSIFLYNVQEPIHVKAMGVVDVGVTTMATILKTSLTYFTFLRSL